MGKWGQAGAADGNVGKDGAVWGSRRGKSTVESDESDKKDTAVGRACVGIRVFLQGGYGGGEGRQTKKWRV